MELNYKLLRIGYISLAVLTIILSIFTIVYIDDVLSVVSVNTLLVISAVLCLPVFVMKFLYEKKYPPTKTQKTIGWLLVVCMAAFLIYEFIRQ